MLEFSNWLSPYLVKFLLDKAINIGKLKRKGYIFFPIFNSELAASDLVKISGSKGNRVKTKLTGNTELQNLMYSVGRLNKYDGDFLQFFKVHNYSAPQYLVFGIPIKHRSVVLFDYKFAKDLFKSLYLPALELFIAENQDRMEVDGLRCLYKVIKKQINS